MHGYPLFSFLRAVPKLPCPHGPPLLSSQRSCAYRLLLLGVLLLSGLWPQTGSANSPQVAAAHEQQQTIPGDMLSPVSSPESCMTVVGDLTATPTIQPQPCRGLASQYWQPDGANKWHSGVDTNYCLARKTTGSWTLTIFPCTDSRTITLQVVNTQVYVVSNTTLALDNYGAEIGLYTQHNGSNQQWRWLQPDLTVVNSQGCAITYPFPASETATYERELSCDRVAKIQPPYVIPAAAQRDPAVFPGTVPAQTPNVTRSYSFDLNFKNHDYLRMNVAPRNWQSTGLYAPPGAIVRVTVSNASAADLNDVYVRLGVHTDQLSPTSGNVAGDKFYRNPRIAMRIKLVPGENLVRNPYGGPIVLDSGTSVNKVITVQIADAVEMPYFVVGQTTEAEWLVRRSAPVPYAELESEIADIFVPASEVSTLSYADVLATAQFYSQVGWLHNELSGLSPNAALPHQTPQGKYRHVEDIQISGGWGHNGFPIMYYNDWHIGVPNESIYRSAGWGVYHELGHNYQMGAWSGVYGGEVTTNLWSLYAQEKLYGNSRLVDSDNYASAIALLNDPAITNKWDNAGVFEQLVFLDQIRLGFPQLNWNLWTQMMRRYRELSPAEFAALNSDQAKRDKFLTILCDITQTNLTPHFETWAVAVTASAKTYCATYPTLATPIWQIDGAKPLYYAGSGSGQVLREWWSDLNGATLADLTNAPTYPNHPTGSELMTGALEGPRDWADDYGERLRGYLHPPVSGIYYFWLAGDDASQFRLSSDEDPLHATQILSLTTATGYRDFDAEILARQRSQPITLEAGRKYYFELIHKENWGGDHLSVAWNIPAAGTNPMEARKVIDGRYLSPYDGDLALHKRLATGQAATIRPGDDVAFTVEIFNQSSATVNTIQIADTLPAGFTLSPANTQPWLDGYRYVRLVATSEAGNRGPWTTVAELNVLDANGQLLPRTNWRLVYTDSQNPDGPATNALDGDLSTHWHTMWWYSPVPSHPHEMQVDLGALYQVGGFTYLPRQSGANGRIGGYRFYVSVDGVNWMQAATGAFPDNNSLQTVTFPPVPTSQALLTIPGPLAPGASTSVNIILRAGATVAVGPYVNSAEIMAAVDATQSNIRDRDSIPDANATNDTWVDDVIDGADADEDDQDYASLTVALVVPTATPTATPTVIRTPTATATPSPTPTVQPTSTPTSQRGDGNGDGLVDAGDLTACVLEIFDGDGSNPSDTGNGTFVGTAGCDANGDSMIDAGDLTCTVLLIFNGPAACRQPVLTTPLPPAQLAIGAAAATRRVNHGPVAVPIVLTSHGHAIAAAAFTLTLGDAFDPTDGDGDGIPDAVHLGPLPTGVAVTTIWHAGHLAVTIMGQSLPFAPLADGPLLTVTVARASAVAVADPSLGSVTGYSVPVQVSASQTEQSFLPMVLR